ncbi:MAG: peptide chain release factor-like protein [Candidatus Hydrogenedentes bacterium]|nr:peptide chain release factor-like protein [Candidatus Hydrogenedentota bacterium]
MPIPEDELDFTFFRSRGPGGQKKNVTDSAVRLRHLPTGITVVAQRGRSQYQNKRLALMELERRLAAMRRKRKPRKPTQPTLASRERRIAEKKLTARRKETRRSPEDD